MFTTSQKNNYFLKNFKVTIRNILFKYAITKPQWISFVSPSWKIDEHEDLGPVHTYPEIFVSANFFMRI